MCAHESGWFGHRTTPRGPDKRFVKTKRTALVSVQGSWQIFF